MEENVNETVGVSGDRALSEFNKQLFRRAEQLGVKLVKVPSYVESSGRGITSDDSSSKCGVCGLDLDRDVKAAATLLKVS